jgi:hypothetical protein
MNPWRDALIPTAHQKGRTDWEVSVATQVSTAIRTYRSILSYILVPLRKFNLPELCAGPFSAHNGSMEECPLIREFQRNPMKAREFLENHRRLGLKARVFVWLLSIFGLGK